MTFNITPPPSEMDKRDEVLAKAYKKAGGGYKS